MTLKQGSVETTNECGERQVDFYLMYENGEKLGSASGGYIDHGGSFECWRHELIGMTFGRFFTDEADAINWCNHRKVKGEA
jgi:hypothetical protein